LIGLSGGIARAAITGASFTGASFASAGFTRIIPAAPAIRASLCVDSHWLIVAVGRTGTAAPRCG
jgi:hypothetical protein